MNARVLDCTIDQYHNDQVADVPTLSASIAHVLVSQSPAHAWTQHPRLGNLRKPATEAQDKGTLIHRLLLGKGKEIVVAKFKDYKTNAAKAVRDEAIALGKIPIKEADYLNACHAATAIEKEMADMGIILAGDSEVPVLFEQTATNGNIVLCRACIDHLQMPGTIMVDPHDYGNKTKGAVAVSTIIYDVKTTYMAHPKAIARHIINYGCDIQHIAYSNAVKQLKPEFEPGFAFIFCETEPPYSVVVAVLSNEFKELGRRKWQRAVDLWEQCLRTNQWPGYADTIVEIEPPTWALMQDQIDDYDAQHGEKQPAYNLSDLNQGDPF